MAPSVLRAESVPAGLNINTQPPPDSPPSKNLWLDHLNLMEDGISDPPGIRVRPMKGLEAVNYLEKTPLLKGASYVFAPVIEKLEAMGYDNSMLRALPYDWRIPPFLLQQRQYFFQYIMYTQSDGLMWIHRHVHLFFALGAPWLGAPKSVRGICVGDKMGLDAFVSTTDAINMSRRMGSAPWLFPSLPELHFQSEKQNFAMMHEEGSITSVPIETILQKAGAQRVLDSYENYYQEDPMYGSGKFLNPPPVPWLLCVYGVNVDTEVSFIACNKPEKGNPISLDRSVSHGTLTCRGGILYETETSVQKILQEESPEENPIRSGDGTVPYASLRYPITWKKQGHKVNFVEIPNALHRDILVHPDFLRILSECASDTFEPQDDTSTGYLQGVSFATIPYTPNT
eukprot:CAMPEP_0206208680 /NCGR_PEP_ID=MMETSP0166-20121206/16433_1 /ASSEMBLY_ACC=CAM_ASM_000260 /TAXON_ID=95228 /ORGANISM="Vannella robusta, Strain DIVA3 518/3/11/1/6" /LENGTH=398 /DNA_ID=CAMNT_0053629883 /DNA_START=599 /DNA_END=1795 /DNA_ORIENTATION=+